jgi:hypothetical protein
MKDYGINPHAIHHPFIPFPFLLDRNKPELGFIIMFNLASNCAKSAPNEHSNPLNTTQEVITRMQQHKSISNQQNLKICTYALEWRFEAKKALRN